VLIFDKKRESYQIVGYKQFDSTDPIIAQFLNDGEPINLSEYNVRFECKKPDGNIVIQDEDIIIKDLCEVEIYLDEQVTVIKQPTAEELNAIKEENEELKARLKKNRRTIKCEVIKWLVK
jgi:hypothetical protein